MVDRHGMYKNFRSVHGTHQKKIRQRQIMLVGESFRQHIRLTVGPPNMMQKKSNVHVDGTCEIVLGYKYWMRHTRSLALNYQIWLENLSLKERVRKIRKIHPHIFYSKLDGKFVVNCLLVICLIGLFSRCCVAEVQTAQI